MSPDPRKPGAICPLRPSRPSKSACSRTIVCGGVGEDRLSPAQCFPQFRRDNLGVNPAGGLTAVAVKVALANPGSHQIGERLFLKMGLARPACGGREPRRGGARPWRRRRRQDSLIRPGIHAARPHRGIQAPVAGWRKQPRAGPGDGAIDERDRAFCISPA